MIFVVRTPTPRSPRQRTSRTSEAIATALLEAAAVEFAAHGFDGASTRRIAERAGAHQPQINYHFSSKEHLWQETVGRLFELMAMAGSGDDPSGSNEGDRPAEVFAATVRRFIRFSALHPELNRIINLEATTPSPRLTWLVSTHLSPLYELLDAVWTQVRSSGHGADLTTAEVWELTTSYGALHFANEPMLAALGISKGSGPVGAAAHAERLLAIVLP